MATTSGSCICKKVSYNYTGEPARKAICHCRQCHKLSGSAFTYNFLVPRESFKWTSGSPKNSSFTQEIGIKIEYHFCPDCGTVLIKQCDEDKFKPFYMVQAGTIDGNEIEEKPDVELWVTRKPGWVPAVQGVGQMEQFE